MNRYIFYTIVSEGDLPFFSRFIKSFSDLSENFDKVDIDYTYVVYFNNVCDSHIKDCMKHLSNEISRHKVVIKPKNTKSKLKKYINEIVESYEGDFYCRLDPDDLIIPSNFLEFILFNNKSKNSDLCYADCYVIDHEDNIIEEERWDASGNEHYFLSQPPHGAYCFISKRLMRIRPFLENIARQDGFEIWLRVLSGGYSTLHYDNFVFKYRRGHPSLSSNFLEVVNDRVSIIDEYLRYRGVIIVITLLNNFSDQIWFVEFKEKINKWLSLKHKGVRIICSYPYGSDLNIKGVEHHQRSSMDLFTALKESVSNCQGDLPVIWLNPRTISDAKLEYLLSASRVISEFKCPLIPTILCRQTIYQQIKGFGIRPINSSQPFAPRAFRKDCYIAMDKFLAANVSLIKKSNSWQQVINGRIWSFELDYMGDLF